ncbi:hypothetical protein OROMI_003629 [Orobanche minor]
MSEGSTACNIPERIGGVTPASSPTSTSPSSSLPSPPTPLVRELAGSIVLPLSISVAPGVSALPSSVADGFNNITAAGSAALVGVRCFIHSEEAGAQLMKENNGTFSVGNGNIQNPVEEAGWEKVQ